jgi:hypothetical protein
MSALPTPQPPSPKGTSQKQAFRSLARLLEEQMEEMGLSEAEKNARTDAFVEDVRKLKASRGTIPSKQSSPSQIWDVPAGYRSARPVYS